MVGCAASESMMRVSVKQTWTAANAKESAHAAENEAQEITPRLNPWRLQRGRGSSEGTPSGTTLPRSSLFRRVDGRWRKDEDRIGLWYLEKETSGPGLLFVYPCLLSS